MLVLDVLSERKLNYDVNTTLKANMKMKEECVIAKLIYNKKAQRRQDALDSSNFEAPNYLHN